MNIRKTLNLLGVNATTGLTQKQIAENISKGQTYEDLQVIDALQSPNQTMQLDQKKKFSFVTQYIPIIISIVISLVGWQFEALSSNESLNLSNLICLLIFLPIFIFNDQYTDLYKQQDNSHSKDMYILSNKQNQDEKPQLLEKAPPSEPAHTDRDTDIIRRRAKEFLQQYFSTLLNQFLSSSYIALREGKLVGLHASELVDGDILFLRENQKVPADCQILPNFSCQQTQQISQDRVYQQAVGYGIGKQPSVRCRFDAEVYKQLLINVDKDQVPTQHVFPEYLVQSSDADKQVKYNLPSEFHNETPNDKLLYSDYLFFGYSIQNIQNQVPLYYFQYSVANIQSIFIQQNLISKQQEQLMDFPDLVFNYLKDNYETQQMTNGQQALVGIKIASGFYSVIINTKSKVYLNKMIQNQNASEMKVNSKQNEFQKKATIPSTFFTHLNSLQSTIQKLPFTMLISILIVFVPHIIRLSIVPNYSQLIVESFTDVKGSILHGLIPTLCAAITFGITSLAFINQTSTLFRPMLKSASKYAHTLEERQISIPTLGSLESLGFTNTIVVDSNYFLNDKKQLVQICIGAKSPRGAARIFSKAEIKKFENVFAHRVLRPFYILYTESETSTWLSLARLIIGLSLQNEEIYQILKNCRNTKNIYSCEYVGQKSTPPQVEDSDSTQATQFQPTIVQQVRQQKPKINQFINENIQMPLYSPLNLHEFQGQSYFDFSQFIQPQCLQESSIVVQQFHPLLTWPNQCFKCILPWNKAIYVIRGPSAAQVMPFCSKIVSHSVHELLVQPGISDITSDQPQEEFVYTKFTTDGSESGQILHRDLIQKDIEYIATQEKLMRQKCTDVVHYAVVAQSPDVSLSDLIKEKQFIYVFSAGFQSSIASNVDEFIKRFQDQNEQLGMNLVMTTKNLSQNSSSLLNILNLDKYIPNKKQSIPKNISNSTYNSNNALNEGSVQEPSDSNTDSKRNFQILQKTPIIRTRQYEPVKKSFGSCIVIRNSDVILQKLTNYILTKSLSTKKHLLTKKLKDNKKSIPKKSVEKKIEEQIPLVQSMQDFDEYITIDDDNISSNELETVPIQKTHKRKHKKPIKNMSTVQYNEPQVGILMKPEIKKQQVNIFLLTETTALEAACALQQKGLFVSYIQTDQDNPIELNEIVKRNSKQTNQETPDFMIVNYQQDINQHSTSEKVVNAVMHSTESRVSTCSIKGKHGLCRLLDVCQEVPFYLMTLSPVFLGTIRSRLMIGLLPIYSFFTVCALEIYGSIVNTQQLQIRQFFYPPIASGAILLFSMLYIEYMLPMIIWTPPKSVFSPQQRKAPQYIGNRAAMLWDFNKMLPKKTSNKALITLSIVFLLSCLAIVSPAANYYFNENVMMDDFISQQQLKLSPFISIYFCMFFTGFANGALLVANKLPLSRVWGHIIPFGLKIKKVLIFFIIQFLCLVLIFVLPTLSNCISQILLGFRTFWLTDNFSTPIMISFSFAVGISIAVILEQVLFVRIE
ncbi:Transmembrane_domain-containing protein [Hexamita inflata]|uniref:Transmembrane domain-containing protein n=1 Tax=Hexamita inflata TaxID=28002 RepID=A0AA86PDV1_9EUKA|nr:Transmembrane domain-containing protein [Hexamita inflata]CAI9950633.1 Transmembrane domain-containing protein [Hexamita inflata]CAI9951984.1 Transmembrane domain-containing protein [Hexamita inflata]